jgi:hypothetical protein
MKEMIYTQSQVDFFVVFSFIGGLLIGGLIFWDYKRNYK